MYNPLKELERAGTRVDGFYRGVVVQNIHPDADSNTERKDGRIRVNIFGVYDKLTADQIPWAEPAMPLNTGGKRDQGSCFIPEVDSYVFCFFDGGDVNHPIYFASCPCVEDSIPDIPAEARESNLDTTYMTKRREERTLSIQSSDLNKWSEPEPWWNARYPWNHVMKFSNGIVIEYDNTQGAERIHIYHPSNSLIEIDRLGNMHIRNSNDKHVLTLRNKNEFIGGDSVIDIDLSRYLRVSGDERKKVFQEKISWTLDKEHVTVDNSKREYVGDYKDLQVISDQRETIGDNKHIKITTKLVEEVGDNKEVLVKADHFEKIDGNQEVKVGEKQIIDIGDNCEINIGGAKLVKVGGNFQLQVGGNLSFKVGGNFNVDASTIHFQEGASSSVSPSSPTEPQEPDAPVTPTKPHEETEED